MQKIVSHRRQGGAMIVTTALVLLFLLGFMGIALDFGRLFIVKTELQTAMDSCALAAAQELDGGADAIARAVNAGKTVGNLNRIHFQGEEFEFAVNGITFAETLTGVYSSSLANPKYAKCEHSKTGMAPWLLGALSSFSGNDRYRSANSVFAVAVATLAPAQSSCPLPVAVCQQPGLYPGQWMLGAVDSDDNVNGNFRWVDLSGDGGNTGIKEALIGSGQCNVTSSTGMKKGNNKGNRAAFNTRFGIYKGSYNGPEDAIPDYTGYAWYAANPALALALEGRYADAGPDGFLAKRAENASYQGDEQAPHTVGLDTDEKAEGKGWSGSLADEGANRRFAVAPVIDCSALDSGETVNFTSMACILLLHPLGKSGGSKAVTNMWLEYVGEANDPDSPCSSFGLVGGSVGPRVPALAQ